MPDFQSLLLGKTIPAQRVKYVASSDHSALRDFNLAMNNENKIVLIVEKNLEYFYVYDGESTTKVNKEFLVPLEQTLLCSLNGIIEAVMEFEPSFCSAHSPTLLT